MKDRWNGEIEKLVRNVQETDWNEKREQAEQRIAAAWGNLRVTEKAQELEQRFKENVDGTADRAEDKARAVTETVKEGVDKRVKEGVTEGMEQKRLLEQ